MDSDALAERILLDLKNIFKKDPLIDEFDILPVSESHRNTSPVIHIDHKVALEDWCIKHVYVYAYSKFFSWRKKPFKVDTDSLLMWSSAILLINPEPETVWNARKELVCQNVALPENELKFSELVLSRKPKSSPVYAHRKWALLELMKSNPSSCALRQVVDHEIHLCTRFANLYPNNYYAWCHRSWVLTQIDSLQHKTVSDELERTEKWTSTHVSDHCGFHYRQFLLSCLLNYPSTLSHKQFSHTSATNTGSAPSKPCLSNEPENCSVQLHFNETIKKELELLGGLQNAYPGHEALWYHRRYILHEIDKLGSAPREGLVRQGDIGLVKLGSSEGNVSGPNTSSGLKTGCSSKGNGVDTSELKFEYANAECYHLSSKNVIQSHIEEIHSFGAENVDLVSMEVSSHCSRSGKVGCANVGLDLSSDERGIVSSIGDIHSLVLDDTESVEGHAQCKRCRMDGESVGHEQVNGAFHSNDSDFENVCSMDSETGEMSSRTPSECKRCKLDCARGQELRSEHGDTIKSYPSVINNLRTHDGDSTMEVPTYSKNNTLSGSSAQNTPNFKNKTPKKQPKSNEEVWSRLEEECFLGRLLVKSREGGWEQTLIQRHVVWLARTLQWSLVLKLIPTPY